MKVAILGYGEQGQSAYEYWHGLGADITICDNNTSLELPEGVEAQLGENYLARLGRFDVIVRSPSVHPRDIEAADGRETLAKVTTVTNEFLRVCPTKNVIGITGTKGKGTTSTLIAKLLEADGKRVHLGGNIGTPPLDLLKNDIRSDDWVVLELANFQLIDLKLSPHIAVCLMVAPEHLDWHADSEEYIIAKSQLFVHQTQADFAIYYADNEASRRITSTSPGQKVPYMQSPGAIVDEDKIRIGDQVICGTNEIKLPGRHNWQNVCAALTAVWQVSQNAEAFKSVLTSFTGLPHRLELVREWNGVRWYDDSFGTTPETAIVALEAFAEPKIIILGGRPKGAPFDGLAETVLKSNVRHVITIGEAGPKIADLLRARGYESITEGGRTMQEIVEHTTQLAQPGDIVLLSPACASFDMFKNYEERGDQFKSALQALV